MAPEKPESQVKVDNSAPRADDRRAEAPPRTREIRMPVETPATDSYREDLVSSGVVIKTEAPDQVYEMGAEKVHALSGVDVRSQGEYVAIHGAIRIGKVYVDESNRLPGFTERGKYWLAEAVSDRG